MRVICHAMKRSGSIDAWHLPRLGVERVGLVSKRGFEQVIESTCILAESTQLVN